MYWSTHDIPAIIRTPGGQDANVRLFSKQFSNVTAYSVAATSYALLAYMQNSGDSESINKMQKFLQEQHMWVGGFSSTQVCHVTYSAKL